MSIIEDAIYIMYLCTVRRTISMEPSIKPTTTTVNHDDLDVDFFVKFFRFYLNSCLPCQIVLYDFCTPEISLFKLLVLDEFGKI